MPPIIRVRVRERHTFLSVDSPKAFIVSPNREVDIWSENFQADTSWNLETSGGIRVYDYRRIISKAVENAHTGSLSPHA